MSGLRPSWLLPSVRGDNGVPRCWNCGSKGLTEKRTLRSKADHRGGDQQRGAASSISRWSRERIGVFGAFAAGRVCHRSQEPRARAAPITVAALDGPSAAALPAGIVSDLERDRIVVPGLPGLHKKGVRTAPAFSVACGDIALLAETGTHVSHNPASNAKLGEGISPVVKLLAAGVNVGLGHDSAEGSNTMDMFDVMRTGAYLHRASHADPTVITVDQILSMATRNGAAALGTDAGALAPGKKADVIIVDARPEFFDLSHEAYRASLEARLVFASNGSFVRTSIIDGAVVMEDRKMLTVDEAEVARNTRVAVAEMVRSLREASS